jgi:hypothetical protein
VSCFGFLTEQQRAALAASSREDAGGAPLSAFASPPASEGKRERVRRLATAPDPALRESAALSVHAPVDVLTALAADPVASVRRCVARHERTPVAVLERLAGDADPLVRGWAAANPAAPAALHARLRDDPDPTVRAVVAWAERW